MSAITSIVNNQIENVISFFNISYSYFKKRNPFINSISTLLKSIYVFLSLGKRLKMMKYQVKLTYYRMHQMEKLIQENNPYNTPGGRNLNKYR
ncbi:MAG TPA: hypothetical protein P5556_10660 [Candidatus Gastranaerophilales bacterium]|nr:hypothetical protein [Candidatus Gastranaerophilales bacterium]